MDNFSSIKILIFICFYSVVLGDICGLSSICDCDPIEDPLNVICQGDFLTIIPQDLPPYIQNLSLKSTMIRDCDSTLGHYTQLIHLDLSDNQIFRISPSAFSRLSMLETLNLNHNYLNVLGARNLEGLSHLLRLHLQENTLSEIHGSVFSQGACSSLTSLDLSHNKLNHLHPNLFQNCHQLQILDLSHNHLTNIVDLPSSSLVVLKLDGNNLGGMQSNSPFRRLNKLKTLSLNDCKLHHSSHDYFDGLNELRSLFLEDNHFLELPFVNHVKRKMYLKELTQLKIGSNVLEKISTELTVMPNLKYLSISGCQNKKEFIIDPDTFKDNHHLHELSIRSCHGLMSLPDNLLLHLPSLQSLSLRGNGLHRLSPRTADWNALNYLDLSDTQLFCDCSLSWILETNYSEFRLLFEASNVTCLEKEGKLSLDSLDCHMKHGSLLNSNTKYLKFIILAGVCAVILLLGAGMYLYIGKHSNERRKSIHRRRINKMDISVITESVSNPSEYKDILYEDNDYDECSPLRGNLSNFPDVKTSVL
ncbi:tsukushi [Lepeophtheirus salmonis]|uniref:tsukushi n=1 Tax=Lepeophtheirus salmonis TaxID=72036 RepID=UPI001AE4A73F|nr:tsukushin-like [Lepeophtheirus salmonis]